MNKNCPKCDVPMKELYWCNSYGFEMGEDIPFAWVGLWRCLKCGKHLYDEGGAWSS